MAYYNWHIINSALKDSKKPLMVIATYAVLVGMLLPSAGLAYSQILEQGQEEQLQHQQQQPDQRQQQTEVFTADISAPIDNFTARGEVGSLVFAFDETE